MLLASRTIEWGLTAALMSTNLFFAASFAASSPWILSADKINYRGSHQIGLQDSNVIIGRRQALTRVKKLVPWDVVERRTRMVFHSKFPVGSFDFIGASLDAKNFVEVATSEHLIHKQCCRQHKEHDDPSEVCHLGQSMSIAPLLNIYNISRYSCSIDFLLNPLIVFSTHKKVQRLSDCRLHCRVYTQRISEKNKLNRALSFLCM